MDIYPKKKNNNNSTCSQGTYTNDVFCSVVEIAKTFGSDFSAPSTYSEEALHVLLTYSSSLKPFDSQKLIPAPLRPQLNIPFTNIVNLNPNPSEQIF